MPAISTILVSRRRREPGADWTGARSWLGGAPRIGAAPWPRDRKGTPLHFLAQLDLAEVAAAAGRTPLPSQGSLAFFAGGEGAVVFVPEGRPSKPAMPPSDTPDLTACGGSASWRFDLAGRPLFPYWPVDFTPLNVPPPAHDEDDDERLDDFFAAEAAVVERSFGRRRHNLSANAAFAGPPIPDWWQNAIQLAYDLERAGQAGQGPLEMWRRKVEQARPVGGKELADAEAGLAHFEAEHAKLRSLYPGFDDFAADVAAWTAGRDPWRLMTPEEIDRLAVFWQRNTEFPKLTGYYGIGPLDWLRDKMFKALPAAGTAAYAALPAHVRDLIDQKRVPHPHWWYSGIHYAQRLEDALRRGVPNATKVLDDSLAAYQRRLDALRPRSGPVLGFGRRLAPKTKDMEDIEAAIATTEGRLDALRQLEPVFRSFVDDTLAWTKGRDPWSRMQPADVEALQARLKRAEEFRDFAGFFAPQRLADLEEITLRALLTGEDRAYASLPEPVRTLVNRDYLLPANHWHQMFGRGLEIQGDSSAMREEGYVMLLQLTYDDLMNWEFGDNGAYQFWIAPADLASGNWARARITFESH